MLNEREDEEQTRRRRKATADTQAHTPRSFRRSSHTGLMTMAITDSSREERLRFQRFTLDFETAGAGTKEQDSLGSFSTTVQLAVSSLNLQRTPRFRARKTKRVFPLGEKGTIEEVPLAFSTVARPGNPKPEKLRINSNGPIFYRDKAVIRAGGHSL